MARRKFTREFKESAVRLVQQQGYSVPQAAQSLSVALLLPVRQFVHQLLDTAGCAAASATAAPS